MAKRQQEFKIKKQSDAFGGSLLKGNPKKARPLHSKLPLHLVLRSEVAKGQLHLRHPRNFREVNRTVYATAKKYGITIYEYANAGNHLHILMRLAQRRLWNRFIRELCGRLAQKVQGLAGQEKAKVKYWTHRPFTRVVRGWRQAYKAVKQYVQLNIAEVEGCLSGYERARLENLRLKYGD